jgi:hypothetical protein
VLIGVLLAFLLSCFLADSNTVYDFKELLYFNFLYSTNRKLKLKYSHYIEADKKKHIPHIKLFYKNNKMVRVIAEMSTVSPVSSSNERYKYRHGSSGDTFSYRRQANASGGGGGGDIDDGERGAETIKKQLDTIHERNKRITMMVEIRRNMQKIHEKQEVREINEKSEKEKQEREQREQEEERRRIQEREQEERRKKEINTKLGKIIYKTRNGGVFEAHHSIHMTVNSNYDRKTRQMVQTYTEKIIWNDRVFESKQEWFSEMNRLSAAEADVNMKIVRWD